MDDIDSTQGGNILIVASGNVKTGSINTHATTGLTGAVEIRANLSGGSTPFVIGGSGSNGVNGTITATKTTGGGTDPFKVYGGVYISNGNASSSGGIQLTTMGAIQVNASASRSGAIILDAGAGKLVLPKGKLQTNGAPGQGAGFIVLLASEIVADNKTTITVNQDDNIAGTAHSVLIAVSKISFGTELEIHANGNGHSSGLSGIAILPQGAQTVTSTLNIQDLRWMTNVPDYFNNPAALDFAGTDSAPLTITANGDDTGVFISGYPTTFAGGDVTIRSVGKINHGIQMAHDGAFDGTKGLAFNNNGKVTINASGAANEDATGGYISIRNDVISLFANSPTASRDIVIKADGPNPGDGDGGTVFIKGEKVELGDMSKARISADGAPKGTGWAVLNEDLSSDSGHAVTLLAGSSKVVLGGGDNFKITATGGFNGGNAGSVKVKTTGNIRVKNSEDTVDASAVDASGNGGAIVLDGNKVLFTEGNDTTPTKIALKAMGGEDADGGTISLSFAPNFDVNAVLDASSVEGTPAIAAAQAQLNPGQKGARIILNDIICQEMQTTGSDGLWPRTYYNCVHPDGPETAEDQAAASAVLVRLTPALRLLGSPIKIYIFKDAADFGQAFQRIDTDLAGTTWQARSNKGKIYSSVFQNGFPVSVLEEIAIHEIGHGFDHVFKQDNQSASTRYINWVQADFTYLDFVPGGGQRPACPNGASVPTPFANIPQVCDSNGNQIAFFGMLNSDILQDAAIGQYWFTAKLNDENKLGWAELYAQALAFQAYVIPTGNIAYIVPDNVFFNGFFQCTRNWAEELRNGNSNPPIDTT
ncbi:MAG: hypothetical protein K8F91_06305, partial [Candidatus Obscuribacterales bacterium]|nr:hypothetical protein [Candidatus Obscuribacterales bacterium]